jgi:hypothetical protein
VPCISVKTQKTSFLSTVILFLVHGTDTEMDIFYAGLQVAAVEPQAPVLRYLVRYTEVLPRVRLSLFQENISLAIIVSRCGFVGQVSVGRWAKMV